MKIKVNKVDDDLSYVKYTGDKENFHKYIKGLEEANAVWSDEYKYWLVPNKNLDYLKAQFLKEGMVQFRSIGETMKLHPFIYQEEAINYSLNNEESLLILPCGAGKTCIGIGAYVEALKNKIIEGPGIIVVKASLKVQWQKEVSKFSDLTSTVIETYAETTVNEKNKIKNREENIKSGKLSKEEIKEVKKEIKQIKKDMNEKFKSQFTGYDLYILNYETLQDKKVKEEIINLKADFAMLDEIQMIKNHKAKKSKDIHDISEDIKFKIGATATPITKNPEDLYSIFKFINPEVFPTLKDFRALYVRYAGRGLIAGFKNINNMKEKISPYLYVKEKHEIADQLPKLNINKIYIDMNSTQLEINERIMTELQEYKDKDFALKNAPQSEIDKDKEEYMTTCAKTEAMILALQTFAQEVADDVRLLQLSDSELAQSYYKPCSSPKLDLCMELVDQIIDSGEKVCIFSRFERMQDILTEAINTKYKNKVKIAYVSGSISNEDRFVEIYEKFQKKDEYKVLLMSEAGAEGINLSKIKYLIEYDLANSYALQTQRHGRLERADSIHDNVFVYQLICNESFDEIAQKIIAKKEGFDKDIIKDLG